jgi:hypothetical protein
MPRALFLLPGGSCLKLITSHSRTSSIVMRVATGHHIGDLALRWIDARCSMLRPTNGRNEPVNPAPLDMSHPNAADLPAGQLREQRWMIPDNRRTPMHRQCLAGMEKPSGGADNRAAHGAAA